MSLHYLVKYECQKTGSNLKYALRLMINHKIARGVARIFGLGGQTVPCRAEPDPASTEVVKSMRGVWVLPPQKKIADPNA